MPRIERAFSLVIVASMDERARSGLRARSSWSARLTAVVMTWLEAMLLFGLVWIAVLVAVNSLEVSAVGVATVLLVIAGAWLVTFTVRALRVSVVVDPAAAALHVRNVYRSYSISLDSIATCRVRAPWQFWRGVWGVWAPAVVLVCRSGHEVPIIASVTDRRARRGEMLEFLRNAKVPHLPTRAEFVHLRGRYVGRDRVSSA